MRFHLFQIFKFGGYFKNGDYKAESESPAKFLEVFQIDPSIDAQIFKRKKSVDDNHPQYSIQFSINKFMTYKQKDNLHKQQKENGVITSF
jgi:hypothetical protein